MLSQFKKVWIIRKLKVIYAFLDLCVKSLQGEIFVVYQMGKVGSATIYRSLLQSGYNVYHAHRINKENIKRVHKEYKDRNIQVPDDSTGLALNLYMRLFQKKIHFITGMRDPIARNLSSYFQNIERYGEDYDSIKNFKDDYDHEVPFRWFKNEFETTFNENVLDLDGLQNNCVLIENEKYTVFIYKLEFGMDYILNSLNKYYSIRIDESENSNISKNKVYAESYLKVKNKIKIDSILLEKMYSNEIVKKFYTNDEIKNFKRRWA